MTQFISLMLKTPACLFWLIVLTLCACNSTLAPNQNKLVLSGNTMGTQYSILIRGTNTAPSDQALKTSIEKVLDSINRSMSTYDANSELSLLNQSRSSDCIIISKPLFSVIETALSLSALSNGAFDITIGPLVNLWGFGPDNNSRSIPTDKQIEQAREKTGYQQIMLNKEKGCIRKLQKELYIDLSAIAKGYAIDAIATLLETHQIHDYLIEIGGDLRANTNQQPWRVAIEKPDRLFSRSPNQIINITNNAVATSGDYRNYFTENGAHYTHIINPNTGKPIQHSLAAVTVINKSATLSDGLATLLLVLGLEQGLALAESENIAAIFISHKNEKFHTHKSSHFKKENF